MLRVEPFTVVPVRPTCSMYLRQLWRLAARKAGKRYIQMKYFHKSNTATATRTAIPTSAVKASSLQMRWRIRLFRIGEGLQTKARRKTNGVKKRPKFSSRKAAMRRVQRGTVGWQNGQNSESFSVVKWLWWV